MDILRNATRKHVCFRIVVFMSNFCQVMQIGGILRNALLTVVHVAGGVPRGPMQPGQRLRPQQPGGRNGRVLGGQQQQGEPQALEQRTLPMMFRL